MEARAKCQYFTDDIFKCIFVNKDICISNDFSLKYFPHGLIDYKSALVQVMARRRTGDKSLPETIRLFSLAPYAATMHLWMTSSRFKEDDLGLVWLNQNQISILKSGFWSHGDVNKQNFKLESGFLKTKQNLDLLFFKMSELINFIQANFIKYHCFVSITFYL